MKEFITSGLRVLLVNILLTLIGLTILLFIFEYQYQSDSREFETTWPVEHHKEIGWIFEPGATVKWTNHSTFWQESKANEMGFLDRPGVLERHSPNSCDIIFLGDSFVEAAQVPVEKKSHIVLERMANNLPLGRTVRTSAFGYSGTGQVSQRPFFDKFIVPLKPDLLIMMVISNDLSDNSPILTSIRNGWHPDFSPRPFYKKDQNGQLKYTLDHPDWAEHLLTTPILSSLKNSAIWKRLGINFSVKYNISDPVIESRVKELLKLDLPGHVSEGIESIKNHADIDFRYRENAVDKEAISITRHVFDYYNKLTRKIGTKILIVYNYDIVGDKNNTIAIEQADQRRNIFLEIGRDFSIPVILMDNGKFISDKTIGKLFLKNDGHWSIEGHNEVAKKVLSFLMEDKTICQ